MPTGKRKVRSELAEMDTEETIDLQFVAEAAGDIPLTPEREEQHEAVKAERGSTYYSDLLFVLTHQRYPTRESEQIWSRILDHRQDLNLKLGRVVGVAVAALDCLSNLHDAPINFQLISDPKFSTVADIALRDGLTGLYDHATFQMRLAEEIERFVRFGSRLSLVMMDVDHFKEFNDVHGHPRGDVVLREIGRIIRAETREIDVAARYGGEEFAVILPGADKTEAFVLAERIRVRVERVDEEQWVTLSAGLATCPDDARTRQDFIRAADEALYAAKQRGRNRTWPKDQ